MRPGVFFSVFREACVQSIADRVPRLGAALAFYMTFSLAPLLLVIIAFAGLIFGRQAAEGELLTEMGSVVDAEAAKALGALIAAADRQGSGLVASLLGCAVSLIGSIGLFCELQDALNTVLEVPPNPAAGWMSIIRTRFLSFILLIGASVLLLVSMGFGIVTTAVNRVVQGTHSSTQINAILLALFQTLGTFFVVTIVIALVYRFLPDVRYAWRNVWLGSVVASVLFVMGKSLLSLYLSQAATASLYGAAASLVVLMLWNYYTAQIFLFGAEVAKSHARRIIVEAGKDTKSSAYPNEIPAVVTPCPKFE